MTTTAKRPSFGWYVLVLLTGVIGRCSAGCAAGHQLERVIADLPRVQSPATLHVVLDSGSTSIIWEVRSQVDGQDVDSGDVAGIRCRMSGPGGKPVTLGGAGYSLAYDLGPYRGTIAFSADLPADGEYELSCEGDDGEPVVAVIGDGLVMPMIATFVLVWLPVAICFGLGALVFVKRRRRRPGKRTVPPGPPPPPPDTAPPPA
jgi:hypothetical protein